MPYGYLGTAPNQIKNNSGVFSVSDINELEAKGHFGGSLELIQSQTASSASAINFTDLGNYEVHCLTLDNFQCTTTTTRYISCRLSNDGGSSYESTNKYDRAWFRIDTGGSSSEIRNTEQTEMSNFFSIDSNNRTSQSVIYFYNLLDSAKYSFVTFHSFNSVGDHTYFGGFSYEVAETINAFSLFPDGDAIATGNAKLYGLKEI